MPLKESGVASLNGSFVVLTCFHVQIPVSHLCYAVLYSELSLVAAEC